MKKILLILVVILFISCSRENISIKIEKIITQKDDLANIENRKVTISKDDEIKDDEIIEETIVSKDAHYIYVILKIKSGSKEKYLDIAKEKMDALSRGEWKFSFSEAAWFDVDDYIIRIYADDLSEIVKKLKKELGIEVNFAQKESL